MSSAMKFEEYLRQQAERGQFGVALIESEIALGIADWIELHRDAVPVVRCKDCRYYKENERWCRRLGLVGAFDKDGFCSRGKRKAAESE